ncbi:MAG TPA: TRAP transporter substrate-binding protein DctP [Rhodospirillales bacterium]
MIGDAIRSAHFRLAAVALVSVFVWDTALSEALAKIDGPEVNWRFSTWGKKRAFTEGVEHLAKRLADETGGKFKLKVFYGEALSKARENLDGLKINAFEGAHFCNFYHPGKNPAYMVFTLPFLPLGDWKTSAAVRNELPNHPALKADLERWNAVHYASTLLPQYEFMGKGKPPLKLEDWKGLRVRAGGGIGDAMEKLGATRQTVTATETYTAIERGAVDAVSFPFSYAHFSYKFNEVTTWYTANMSPGTTECPVVFNKTAYDKLPAQYKKLLADLRDEVTKVLIDEYEKADKVNVPKLEKTHKKIVYDAATLKEFHKIAGKPVWDKWIADNKDKFDAKGVFDAVWEIAKKAK